MKLFNYFAAGGFHSSIISTFGIDFDAYEAIALPRLRDAGCNNNVVVADARMLSQALTDEARRPRFAGRRYSVVGAHCAGVFHPKVSLQLGKTSGRLLVSSANMTAAGLAGNLEVAGEVSVAEGNMLAAPLLRAAVDYLLKFLAPGSVARRQVEWAIKRTRWLPTSASSEAVIDLQEGMRLAFLARHDAKGIGQWFAEFIGNLAVKRLVVASPYWDHDLRSLRNLQARFGARETMVLIQPKAALYPVHAHPTSEAFKLFDVSAAPGAVSRFAHAKLIIAEAADRDVILFGSANCTEAALGTPAQAGVNEEACLVRELPAGEAVPLLGLDGVLSMGEELDPAKVPTISLGDDIPLSDLEARLAGRFELSGDLLRWWPPASLATDMADIHLLDQLAEPVAGNLSRVGDQSSPAIYRFDGTVAPHFAQVRSEDFESSLAVVVVEQAIHQAQRRAAGRLAESALELLDDDDAYEGLWLLDVIQRLTEAEREMRGPRSTAEQTPQQKAVAEPALDARVLPYEDFVAGRRSEDDGATSAGSHLASTHHESVRGFLNALIGKSAALDVLDGLDDETPPPNLGLGDETADGGSAVESGDMAPSSAAGAQANQEVEAKRQLERRQRYVQDTQRSIVDGVEAFLKGLRIQGQDHPLGVVDLLRLRALLVVVLGAGSMKADLRPKDLNVKVRRRQVLPSSGDASWRRLVGRLLYDFFRDHVGTRMPLIKSLQLESDDGRGLPEDVLECWATCFWALCSMRVAVNDAGVSFAASNSEAALAADLYRFTNLLPQQALGAVVLDVFAGMNRRYAERIGVCSDRMVQEHHFLAEAARVLSSTPPGGLPA
ncbi:hypothetical protein [Pseudacidovorax sp. RU35E]|uniref:hypothetical protein n=1 Tax=Pseudacidovorax sp. RU35E TaxID=1907403 RepID=UPI000955F18D|nr:hypothetical protein [Pseudacidovorax sp. RU35E]SIR51430.1 hypothetical protein SAMN05880557_112114 [Pseudacidovorax sp. RU35E]